MDIGRRVKAGEKLVALAVPELEADRANKEAVLEQARNQRHLVQESRTVAGKDVQEAREQEKRYQADFTFRREQNDRTAQLISRGALQPEKGQETLNQMEGAEAGWRAARVKTKARPAKADALVVEQEVAESRIKVAQTEVERLKTLIGQATVRTPFDGVVTKRWLDRGTTIKDAAARC